MKNYIEPKSLFVFISVVFVSVVIIVGAIGFYIGNKSELDASNVQDASAATDSVNDGDIYFMYPDRIALGEIYPLSFSYYGEYPENDLPDWTITICGKTRTKKNAQSVSINHKFTKAGNCPVKVSVKATEDSSLSTTLRVYNIKNNHKNVQFFEDGNDYTVNNNLVVGISHTGVVNKTFITSQWEWKATGVCRLVNNFDLGVDSIAVFSSSQPGLCKVSYKTYVFYKNFAVKVTGNKNYTMVAGTSNVQSFEDSLQYDTNLIEDNFMETNESPPEPDGNICGPMDHNGDGILNIIDFYYFSLKYGRGNNVCLDGNTYYGVCGGKDVDTNGKLEINDFYSFVKRYRLKSCTLGNDVNPTKTPTPTPKLTSSPTPTISINPSISPTPTVYVYPSISPTPTVVTITLLPT